MNLKDFHSLGVVGRWGGSDWGPVSYFVWCVNSCNDKSTSIRDQNIEHIFNGRLIQALNTNQSKPIFTVIPDLETPTGNVTSNAMVRLTGSLYLVPLVPGVKFNISSDEIKNHLPHSVTLQQISGPTVVPDLSREKYVEFKAPYVAKDTMLKFNLTATDDKGVNATDQIGIMVRPNANVTQ
jgi:hypothetical protein